jgi:hypothetical protein
MYKSNSTELKSSNSLYILLVFLLSPFIAVYISAINYKQNWAKNIIWLFCAYYGYSFVIGNKGADINRYKVIFDLHFSMNLSVIDFFNVLLKEGNLDFLQPLISYTTSIFTGNFQFFIMIAGIIFGFFFSRNIWNILSIVKVKPRWYGILFIIIFTFLYAVWDINVMRFTLAAQIFFYGCFNHLVNKKKWGLLFVFISPFMHFSFSIAIVVFLFYRVAGNFIKIYFICFIVSFTISEISLDVFKSRIDFLPQNYLEKSEDYINEDYKELKDQKTENKNFRGKFYQLSLKLAVTILLSFIFLKRKNIRGNVIAENLLAFTLLFIAVFNILSVIPSMNRFLFVGYLFAFALFYIYFNLFFKENEMVIIYISTPLILFFLIMKLRIGLEFTGVLTLIGGVMSALFNVEDIALIEFIK